MNLEYFVKRGIRGILDGYHSAVGSEIPMKRNRAGQTCVVLEAIQQGFDRAVGFRDHSFDRLVSCQPDAAGLSPLALSEFSKIGNESGAAFGFVGRFLPTQSRQRPMGPEVAPGCHESTDNAPSKPRH